MISFSVQNSDTSNTNLNETIDKKHTPCQSKCMACQQTAYNIKFYQKANCKRNQCKTTVLKLKILKNTKKNLKNLKKFSATKSIQCGTNPNPCSLISKTTALENAKFASELVFVL